MRIDGGFRYPAWSPASPAPERAKAADPAAPAEAGADAGAANRGREVVQGKLTKEEQEEVRELSSRDAEVRAHEAAHAAAAGGLGGGAHFHLQTGPDGKQYAVGGEVPIRLEQGRTPEETIQNARTVRAAALAPANPSSQDRAVAAAAAQMETRALQEATSQRLRERSLQGRTDERQQLPPARPREGIETASPTDADAVAITVASERRLAFGDRGHAHPEKGCGPCGAAVSRYR